jgi:hypothetical protein
MVPPAGSQLSGDPPSDAAYAAGLRRVNLRYSVVEFDGYLSPVSLQLNSLLRRFNSLFDRINSLFDRFNSLFACLGNVPAADMKKQ